MGITFSKKAKRPTSTANEEEDVTGVDFSQAESAQHPSESTESLSVSQVPPFSVATSSINIKRNPSKAAASTSKSINPPTRVLRSHQTQKLRPRGRQIIRGRRVTISFTKSKKSHPIAKKKQHNQATEAIKASKSRDETIKCTTSDNRNVCMSIEYISDFRVHHLTSDDRSSSGDRIPPYVTVNNKFRIWQKEIKV